MSHRCEHGKDSDVCVQCWEEKNLEPKDMTTPIQPSELDKALEDARFAMREHERLIIKGSNFYPIKDSTLGLLFGAAERLKEVEKERDEARNIIPDCAKEIESLRDQLSQLRTAYKEALEALKHWKSYSESPIPANEDEQEQAGEDFTNVWFETDAILSNPLAIEIMKEKKGSNE